MKGGYTEAELLAAEWSKQRKKQSEEGGNRKDIGGRDDKKAEWKHDNDRVSTYRRHERKRQSDSRDRFPSDRNDCFDGRSDFRRSGDNGARTSHRTDDRDHGMIERGTDNDGGRNERKIDIDEFGREIVPGRTAPGRRRDSRSRSRSRTRSAPRNRSRSRSRSRSRQQFNNRRENSSWKHDKFDRDQRYVDAFCFKTLRFDVYTNWILHNLQS